MLQVRNDRLNFAVNHHVSTRGTRLDFDRFFALREIYASMAPHIVIQSSVQSGKSEWQIVETFACSKNGLSVFVVLPKFGMRNTFVANRVDKCIRQVPLYRRLLHAGSGRTNNRGLKHFGSGTIRYAGSNAISEFKEFPADVLVIDEMDHCDNSNLPYADDRLAASPLRIKRKVGNPTLDGFGINKSFLQSTQKEWHVRCTGDKGCGTWVKLDWFETVVRPVHDSSGSRSHYELRDKEWTEESKRDIAPVCPQCGNLLKRLSPEADEARWIATAPESSIEGYHISKLISPLCTIRSLWETFQEAQGDDTKMQRFYNSDLGLPFTAVGERLTDQLIADAVARGGYSQSQKSDAAAMGVDVGKLLYYEIAEWQGDVKRVIKMGRCIDFHELDGLITQFGVFRCVIDANPEQRKAEELASRHPGVVYLAYYPARPATSTNKWLTRWNHQQHTVDISRTAILDVTLSRFRRGTVTLPGDLPEEYRSQLKAPIRRIETDRGGNPVARYVEGSKQDHFAHAAAYCEAAHQADAPRLWVL